jgi:hypothetical protein
MMFRSAPWGPRSPPLYSAHRQQQAGPIKQYRRGFRRGRTNCNTGLTVRNDLQNSGPKVTQRGDASGIHCLQISARAWKTLQTLHESGQIHDLDVPVLRFSPRALRKAAIGYEHGPDMAQCPKLSQAP